MHRRLTSQDITWFLDLHGLGRLDLEPAYQRRSVWTRRDRQFFLDTIFNNYPSPAIFLHKDLDDHGNATYHVVDGKQRLETILEFVANRLPIKDDFGDARLNNKKWRDLAGEQDLKKTFFDYLVTVEMLDSVETTVVNEIFGRLNRNARKLERQEVRHARYDGWFVNRAEQETEEPFWKTIKVATAGRHKRMQDTQFISELMAATITGKVNGFDQDALDEFYALYEFPEDLEPPFSTEDFNERFGAVRSFLQHMEESANAVTRYATNLAHLYTLWVWLASQASLPQIEDFASRYSAFMQQVLDLASEEPQAEDLESGIVGRPAEVVQYLANARGATTDYAPRLARHQALSMGLGHTSA